MPRNFFHCRLATLPFLVIGALARLGFAEEATPEISSATLNERLVHLEQQVTTLRDELTERVERADAAVNADNAFSFGGYGLFDYTYQRDAGHALTAQFQPIFAYAYREEALFVGELNLDTTGTIELTQAYMAYTGLAHAVLEVGKFPLPFAAFSERFSPAWINKLAASAPAPYDGDFGLFASDQADIGAQVRGDLPVGSALKLNYSIFVTAGPSYNSTDGTDDRLSFATNTGANHVLPTLGARFGILPIPGYEMGLSAMTGHIANNVLPGDNVKVLYGGLPGYESTDSRAFAAYAVDIACRRGGFLLTGEIMRIDADDSTNERGHAQGGYLQVAQRLSFLANWFSDVEPVVRVGAVVRNQALLATADDGTGNTILVATRENVEQVGVGVNYYFTPGIRASVLALGHNDHDLDRASFTTTFAF